MTFFNLGYERYCVWTYAERQPLHEWGEFMDGTYSVTVGWTISGDGHKLTAEILDWNFDRLPPAAYGNGFIDVCGFSWYDDERSDLPETWIPNNHQGIKGAPPYIPEIWGNVAQEGLQVETMNHSVFWDNCFYKIWQNNKEGESPQWGQVPENPVGATHTWNLTDDDWDANGQMKDRIVILVWIRHYDDDIASEHWQDHPRTAHWKVHLPIHFTFEHINWKFHPMNIRKGGEWYSCNRLNREVGHGDGHLAIRKGGRWNGVWNDDFKPQDSEGYYDDDPEGQGPFVYLPRSGIGAKANRAVEEVHEWED